ncbi:hypothetical protein GCM10007049_31610 [Echinicola pacifica]|uniref:DUF3575 domain-containing protein n=1 Tax=Echinicola pacifica TaxID=346377 RepID=A0A918Q7T8_9BACT|nr:hypothetical protein [Echinicola pacifica]GGZ35999.1 hypothetical protein GCM10007049_31610 [Echinicola pacifica]
MKKFLLVFLLAGLMFHAQAQSDSDFNRNEIKLNIMNTILQGSVEIGYERFIDADQSVGVEYLINDRFGYNSQKKNKEFNTSSLLVSYNFYFTQSNMGSGRLYVYPFFKYRFGDFTEPADGGGVIITDMNSAMLGIGGGYKWVQNDKFAIAPYINIARGFSGEVQDRFSAIELNAGLSVGYRF